MSEFAVEVMRRDGWHEAGRGWEAAEDAAEDALKQLPEGLEWRVVEIDPPQDES